MNDIERLAAFIKDHREGSRAHVPPDDVRVQPISEVDALLQPPEAQRVVTGSTNASNDTLLNDLATDFGLSTAHFESVDSSATARQTVALGAESQNPAEDPNRSKLERSSPPIKGEAPSINIPFEKLATQGFITPSTTRGLITEQYRRIKRPLLKNLSRNERGGMSNNVIMVTSSVSGEGKTFTAINLAMSFTMERDKTVLLIDADVLKNTASGLLEVDKNSAGLTDLLVGNISDPDDVILRTNIPNFMYLPSGRPQQHANERLSSGRMKELVEELSTCHNDRIIVLDCSPILQTNEAAVLTDHADQVVFVVAEEETSEGDVVEALSQIPSEIYVGVVLNKSRLRVLGNDYGYTYKYG